MKLNPYESPQPGDPSVREALGVGDSDSIRRLLTEIRDNQRELLEIQRESTQIARDVMQYQNRWRRFGFAGALVPLLFVLPMLYFSYSRIRAPPHSRPRTPHRPAAESHPCRPSRANAVILSGGQG